MIGTDDIGHLFAVCAADLLSVDRIPCTSCSGELLEDIVKSMIPPVGMSPSTFGEAVYLGANVGGFSSVMYTNSSILPAVCLISQMVPPYFSVSE